MYMYISTYTLNISSKSQLKFSLKTLFVKSILWRMAPQAITTSGLAVKITEHYNNQHA